jgi:hypothetical protein
MTHERHYTKPVHEHIEEWHRHTSSEGDPQHEHGSKPNIPLLLGAFLASVTFVGITILATYLYFGVHMQSLRAARMENTALAADYLKYRDATLDKLAKGDQWLNDEAARAGLAPMPLEKAKEKILARYGAK